VLATSDYPKTSTALKGLPPDVSLPDGAQAFWGGSTLHDGKVDVSGGRVLTVTAVGSDLETARSNAYEAVKQISTRFDAAGAALSYRGDIAKL
jgi:phosphoribosylamine--glycine ligase